MYLQELRLRQFRNYDELDLPLHNGLNVFVGQNAQGKSNLLEAVYLLATSRSLRASRESEMIFRPKVSVTRSAAPSAAETAVPMAAVSGEVIREREGDVELELSVYPTDKKTIRINGIRRTRVIELLGQLNAVFFGALDLGIVSGEPSLRRRYLNLEISQISPKYCFDLVGYKKVLEQRNRLLRDLRDRPYRDSGLDVWNEQLIRYGAPLIERRRFFVERLAPLADDIHRELTEGKESLTVRYLPSIPLPARTENAAPTRATESPMMHQAYQETFRNEMERVGMDELRRGTTLAGPQRDDVQFLINGMDARTFGSQGQQRTVVLSLKLAEYRLMEEYVGEPPVLLLDDVMSDLDDMRRQHLLGWMHRRCQTLLTCTNVRAFPKEILENAAIFQVQSGCVTKQTPEAAHALPAEDALESVAAVLSSPTPPEGETDSSKETGERVYRRRRQTKKELSVVRESDETDEEV